MRNNKQGISFIVLASLLFLAACKPDSTPTPKPTNVMLTPTQVSLVTHKLATFSVINNSKYLIVFESGLGNDHKVWNYLDVTSKISNTMDVVLYDRAGIGESENGPTPRDINRLKGELDSIISYFSNGRKVVLVGHSLGGLIIRDWAIKNPSKIAAILFVDPTHEAGMNLSQADEDYYYNSYNNYYGPNHGGTLEARELIEDLQYASELPNLPDVPVIVLTAMKVDGDNSTQSRNDWYNAHELLKNGVTDFTHIGVSNSGHFIMTDQPTIVINNLNLLLSKLHKNI